MKIKYGVEETFYKDFKANTDIDYLYIPIHLSIKLKALDFNEPCTRFVNYISKTIEEKEWINWNEVSEFVSIPMYSQAFNFFIIKYGIYAPPQKFDETKWWVNWGSWRSPVFNSLEESQIAWLEKIIEMAVIIKKSKKAKKNEKKL